MARKWVEDKRWVGKGIFWDRGYWIDDDEDYNKNYPQSHYSTPPIYLTIIVWTTIIGGMGFMLWIAFK